MRIGILGGTFDPIHKGHLYLASKVCKKLSLEKIFFIPTHLPPHKRTTKITAARHRYNIVKIAIANNKKFKVSDIEIKRKGRSYSVETLRQLRKKYGAATEIFFIVGSDSLKELDKWKNLKEILGLCKFVVVERPRFRIKNVPRPVRKLKFSNGARHFIILFINAKDIASTDIRNRIKKGQSISKLVPKKVRDYITAHKLYL